MVADLTPEGFRGGKALLDRLRLDPQTDSLGVDLAVALGILIGEGCVGDDLRLPVALANRILLASAQMQRTILIVSSCAGSA
jgi:hypothetical protein